jgi:hypothetical protein
MMTGMSRCVPSFFLAFGLLVMARHGATAQTIAYEEAPHHYWTAPLKDAGSTLDAALQSGQFTLPAGNDLEALRAVLRHLKIPESSQTLVFSKTSVQKDHISPWNPRALYFNDECYAGWVPGGQLEFAFMDPILGPIFYLLDLDRPDRPHPRLDRPQACLDCHGSNMTNRLPGVMIRSVFPDKEGSVLFQAGTSLIDHTSPVEIRWGGWYVTGTHGSLVHRGNAFASDTGGAIRLHTTQSSNLQSLARFFPEKNYPRRTSDIVALMVLEHQVMMSSRLVEASYDVRAALARQKALRAELGDPPTEEIVGTARIIADSHVTKLLDTLLFKDEAELPEGGIQGHPGFQHDFCANRPVTPDGRSLTEFHLGNRLFRHRCSYLIYSRQWAALPAPFLDLVYDRLHAILTAPDPPPGYTYLSKEERQAIYSILQATMEGLPDAWER